VNDTSTYEHIDIQYWMAKIETLPEVGGLPPTEHWHDEDDMRAVNVALAAGRPLLVRGEPGTGKSQLARMAAERLGRRYLWQVMNTQTKISDLFYDFDAIGRLAHAQVVGALAQAKVLETREDVEAELDVRKFVRPGLLWRAFDDTRAQAWPEEPSETTEPTSDRRPCVVLIDEIDKTDPSVPNGLLEALGQGTFPVLRDQGVVSLHQAGMPGPLIVLTTNNERELPAAFVRRCLVHRIRVPSSEPSLVAWLVERGKAHFRGLSPELLQLAAEMVHIDREAAKRHGVPPPGQAEYLDLLRAVNKLRPGDSTGQAELLKQIKDLALVKHPDLHDEGDTGARGDGP